MGRKMPQNNAPLSCLRVDLKKAIELSHRGTKG